MKATLKYVDLEPSLTDIVTGEVTRKQWNSFSPATRDIDYFAKITKGHQLLNIEYSVHCALVRELIIKNDGSEQHKINLMRELEAVLVLAELLECVHRYYLMVPHEVARFRCEQAIYREHLAQYGYEFKSPIKKRTLAPSLTKIIREQTVYANLLRHIIARSKRLLTFISPVLNHPAEYKNITGSLDYLLVPAISFAAWLFFVPRACVNLYLMGKHLIPGSWMSEQEKALGFGIRFKSQMDRRWFELSNDIVSLLANSLNCFLFVGSLLPLSLYVTVASLAYKVCLASLRAYIDISRLKKLEYEYKETLTTTVSAEECDEIKRYIHHLQQRIAFEQKRLYAQVAITATLLLAFILTFPIVANPIVAIVGAALAVLTTALSYGSIQWLAHQKPPDAVPLPPALSTDKEEDASMEVLPLITATKTQSSLARWRLFKSPTLKDLTSNESDPELARFVID